MSSQKAAFRWQLPVSSAKKDQHQLKILNSFTKKKELFVSNNKKTIKWYSCGPTVYDVSHLGHARCYITFDIIRRILTEYFGFNVYYVMNITDIDDKIIKRARSNYLFDKYVTETMTKLNNSATPATFDTVNQELKNALDNYVERKKNESDPDKTAMIRKIIESSSKIIQSMQQNPATISQESLNNLKDILAEELDSKLYHTVSDPEIFKILTVKFEQEFHKDMLKLNILPPSTLTRVSEYIEEISEYIKVLEKNGYAYRSNGSVYFDSIKFDNDPKHFYAKLVREAFGHKKSLDEGEGELSSSQDTKKSLSDFALWKKSKDGEPRWKTKDLDSGRPGWHIECSVMASKMLGENFDIHSGGCDLKFPHHDNEIAQAEAYYDSGKNWVNYFIHSGHLTISGCKMSKSLKNFVTILQALDDYSPRQLRFAFLVHSWAETLDYSTNTMNTAISYEKAFSEFFLNASATLRQYVIGDNNLETLNTFFKKWNPEDTKLNQQFLDTIENVDSALCDNFDTRSALNCLSSLIKEYNKKQSDINFMLLKDIAFYIKRILAVFGAEFNEISLDKYYTMRNNEATSGRTQDNSEKALNYVEALALFRSQVRNICKAGDAKEGFKKILSLCDNLRDQILPTIGVRLEDREADGTPYVVKLIDPETLAKERALADKLEQEKLIKEETAMLQKLNIHQQREEKAKIPPREMFKSQTDEYSQFDDTGMPTHDSSGKEISKSKLKKLQRLYADQQARYSKYMESKCGD